MSIPEAATTEERGAGGLLKAQPPESHFNSTLHWNSVLSSRCDNDGQNVIASKLRVVPYSSSIMQVHMSQRIGVSLKLSPVVAWHDDC